jgi:hypothetical protein
VSSRRDWVLEELRQLANIYIALEGRVPPEGRRQRGSSPTIPINADVIGHLTLIEDTLGDLVSRGRGLLGWHLPPVPLARRHHFIPCPYCTWNSLWVNRSRPPDLFVYCGNPACRTDQDRRREWHWGEVEQLGDMVVEVLAELQAELEPQREEQTA